MWKAGICASQRVPERGTELPAEKTRHETIRRDFTPAAEDITFAIDSNKSINSTIKILYDYPQKYPLCACRGGGKCQGFAGITDTFPVKCLPEVCSGHGGHIA